MDDELSNFALICDYLKLDHSLPVDDGVVIHDLESAEEGKDERAIESVQGPATPEMRILGDDGVQVSSKWSKTRAWFIRYRGQMPNQIMVETQSWAQYPLQGASSGSGARRCILGVQLRNFFSI